MPNYKIAEPGHSFVEGKVNLSWGIGRAESDVISLPIAEQSARFKQRLLAGVIVETKDPSTESAPSDIREYRLMTGEEARAHKAIPAGPVTRNVYNPVTGEMVAVEFAHVRVPVEASPVPEALDDGADQPSDPADASAEVNT